MNHVLTGLLLAVSIFSGIVSGRQAEIDIDSPHLLTDMQLMHAYQGGSHWSNMVIEVDGTFVEFRWRLVGEVPRGMYAPGLDSQTSQQLPKLRVRKLRVEESLEAGELNAQDAEREMLLIERARFKLDPDGNGTIEPFVEIINGDSVVTTRQIEFERAHVTIGFGPHGGTLVLSPERATPVPDYPKGTWTSPGPKEETVHPAASSIRAVNSVLELEAAGIAVPEPLKRTIQSFRGVPVTYPIRDQIDGVWSFSSQAYGEAQIELRILTTDSCDQLDGRSGMHAIALACITPANGEPIQFSGPVHWVGCGHVDDGEVQIDLSRFDGHAATCIRLGLNDDLSLSAELRSSHLPDEAFRATRTGDAPFPERLRQIPEVAPVPNDQDFLDSSNSAEQFHALMKSQGREANVLLVYDPDCDRSHDAMERLAGFQRQMDDSLGVFTLSVGRYTRSPRGEREADKAVTRSLERGWPVFYFDQYSVQMPSNAAFPAMDRIHALPAFVIFDDQGVVHDVYCGLGDNTTNEPNSEQLRHLKGLIQRLISESP